jgi:hypothetical protein
MKKYLFYILFFNLINIIYASCRIELRHGTRTSDFESGTFTCTNIDGEWDYINAYDGGVYYWDQHGCNGIPTGGVNKGDQRYVGHIGSIRMTCA